MSEKLKTEKVIKNTFWATFGYIVYAFAGFVSRSIFVNQLGDTITGVATLFSSILNLLSMTELGFGTAISVHLYKPISENDNEKISALINLYRKAYMVVAASVFVLGMIILPFLNVFVKTTENIPDLKLYFFLYILKSVASYCYAYKSVLLTVSQESFYASNITNFMLTVVTIAQTIILHYFANFTMYLVVAILGVLITNISISAVVDRKYPYLKKFEDARVSKEEKKDIFAFIKASSVDKISGSVKTATDNMIISGFINVAVTGIVGNYNMIVTTAYIFLNLFFNNVSPAVGNLCVTENKEAQYNTLMDLEYVTFWLYGFVSVGMFCTITPFVTEIWLKKPDMVLQPFTLLLIVFNFFITGTCLPSEIYFSVNGLIKKFPFINVINVILNLILSIGLVYIYDVNGVYIGTVLSYVLTNLTLTHYIVFKYHFDNKRSRYFKLYFKCMIIVAAAWFISYATCKMIITVGIVGLLIKMLLCTVIFNFVFLISTFRSREFKSIIGLVKKILNNHKI